MMVDCREDPCGECRYCRFEAGSQELELPTDAGVRWLTEGSESPCIAPPGSLCTETGCWDMDRCVFYPPVTRGGPDAPAEIESFRPESGEH